MPPGPPSGALRPVADDKDLGSHASRDQLSVASMRRPRFFVGTSRPTKRMSAAIPSVVGPPSTGSTRRSPLLRPTGPDANISAVKSEAAMWVTGGRETNALPASPRGRARPSRPPSSRPSLMPGDDLPGRRLPGQSCPTARAAGNAGVCVSTRSNRSLRRARKTPTACAGLATPRGAPWWCRGRDYRHTPRKVTPSRSIRAGPSHAWGTSRCTSWPRPGEATRQLPNPLLYAALGLRIDRVIDEGDPHRSPPPSSRSMVSSDLRQGRQLVPDRHDDLLAPHPNNQS